MFSTFSNESIRNFLVAMDRFSDRKRVLILIGGSAAALAYGIHHFTKDIDIFLDGADIDAQELQRLQSEASQYTHLDIPVELVSVADAPYNYQDRLEKIESIGTLQFLDLYCLERHDFFLMKIIRGYEHDIEHLIEIHKSHAFSVDILCERFIKEMDHVMLDRRMLKNNFLNALSNIYADVAHIEQRLAIEAAWLTR